MKQKLTRYLFYPRLWTIDIDEKSSQLNKNRYANGWTDHYSKCLNTYSGAHTFIMFYAELETFNRILL